MNALVKLKDTSDRFISVKPSYMNFDAEYGFAVQLLKNNDYLLSVAEGNPESLQQAMVNVGAIGLTLNPAEKQAYLIPRTVKQNGKYVSKIFLEPSYIGLIRLATNSGSIEWVQSKAVYSNDEFIDNGVGLIPTHQYNAFAKESERGDFVGVYCVAKTKQGDYLTTIMPAEKIYDIRSRSEGYKAYESGKAKSCVWVSDFTEMAKKAAIRNAFKTWPRSDENQRLAQAIHLSDENEGFEPIQTSPRLSNFTVEQKEYLDSLLESGNNLALYVFKESLVSGDKNTGTWVSLCNSFKRGEKGKYGDLIIQMTREGESQFLDIVDAVTQSANNGDDLGVKEVIGELTDDEYKLLVTKLSIDLITFVESIRKDNK